MQYYNNNNNQLRPPQFGLKGYPVSSIEEARAAIVDFDGSIFFYPDVVNKKIYTKKINMDGTASLNMYVETEIPVEKPISYITKEEFDDSIQELKNTLLSLIGPKEKPKTTF